MPLTIAYPSSLYSQPMRYPFKPKEGALAVPVVLNYTPQNGVTGVTGYTINLGGAGAAQQNQFSQLVTIFIDNSNSPGTTVVSVVGTPQTIAARPFSRGYYPVNASNLNLVVTNNATVNSTVELVCLNYIVEPSIDTAVPSALGDQDAVIETRIGNTAGCGQLSPTSGITVLGGFAQSSTDFPFYYLTGFDATWFGNNSSESSYINLVDVDLSNTILNTFATFFVFGDETTPRLAINRSGICVSGTGRLAVQVGSSVVGILALNWYGGRSKSAVTAAQFAVVT